MIKTLACHNEAARLKTLRQYQILDTPPEQPFEDLVFLATQICGTPITSINLIDQNRQWFKAKAGLNVNEIPRDIGFAPICMHLGEVLIIPDTLADEQFATNLVVTSYPYVRFYVGVPLKTPEGEVIGALSIADRVPRTITPEQVEALRSLSRLIVRQLDIRRNLAELASIKAECKQVEEQLCKKEKKQLDKQFLRAQRMESIGTLASGIAHDLNNVLSPILMSVHLLKGKCQDERAHQILKIVESNAKRGANLVKQVLSFAKGIEGDRTVLQLKHLILEMKQIVEQTFPKSITVSTEIQPDLWHVCGDSTQLHQVMMNLYLNARDAMPEGGNLQISAKNIFIDENYTKIHDAARVGSYIVLTVSDTGVGIPHEQLERIFEPFFTTKEFDKGTGLGLSTVMGIVKSHGGFITVSSLVNKGTLFQVYLPSVQTATIQSVEELELITGYGEGILIVDDEAAVRDITKATLENNNYKVITARDGIEAVELFAQHKDEISAAIIDMMMPNMNGEKTIRALQKINPLLRIIAVSGLTISEQVTLEQASQQTAFLPKPHTAQELLKALHTIISSRC